MTTLEPEDFQKILNGENNPINPKDMSKVSVSTPDGKPASIDDYDSFMSFLMQASQLAQLTKIRKYFDDRTSRGLNQAWGMDPNNPLIITDQLTVINVDYPAQSFSLHNDGPDTVYVWVNGRLRPPAIVNSGETMNEDFETHKLNNIPLQCDPTQTAAVRIVAKD